MKNRMRPPKRSRTLLNTSLSASPCCRRSGSGTPRPSASRALTSRPTPNAQSKIFFLAPPSASVVVTTRP